MKRKKISTAVLLPTLVKERPPPAHRSTSPLFIPVQLRRAKARAIFTTFWYRVNYPGPRLFQAPQSISINLSLHIYKYRGYTTRVTCEYLGNRSICWAPGWLRLNCAHSSVNENFSVYNTRGRKLTLHNWNFSVISLKKTFLWVLKD